MRCFAKQTLRSVVFIIGLIILLLICSHILSPKNNSKKDGMQDSSANGILSEPSKSIDVLMLGDSESYCSMIPLRIWEEQGITSYCCATPAQKLVYSEEFLYKTFKNQSPKVVILETNAIFRKFSVGDMIVQKADVTVPIFRHHDRWKSIKSSDFGLATKYTYIDNAKGYKFTSTINPADSSGYMAQSDKLEPIPSKNRKYVENIMDYCNENGAKLILVSTPSVVNWNMARHNSMQKMSEELGLTYIDTNLLSEEIPIDWQNDTGDKGDHMNYFGAQKVTSYLGEYLAGMGLFTSHKSDIEYKQWNEHLESFNATVEKSLSA